VGRGGFAGAAPTIQRMDAPDGATPTIADLTCRELEVLRRTATGRTNADVAAELGVSVHAVKFHLASIFRKLDVHNRTEAAVTYLAASRASGEEAAR
jgi:DNA-binding NarL/FixJ family response regulator